MAGHAPFPHSQDHERIRQKLGPAVVGNLVKEHISQSSANQNTKNSHISNKIRHFVLGDRIQLPAGKPGKQIIPADEAH